MRSQMYIINRSIDQSVNQLLIYLFSQSILQTVSQSINQSINRERRLASFLTYALVIKLNYCIHRRVFAKMRLKSP